VSSDVLCYILRLRFVKFCLTMAARYKPTNLIFRISYESNNEKTRAGV